MEPTQEDLLQDFAVVARTFEQLSQRLTHVAEQVRTTGALPADTLIQEITTSRQSFTDLRAKALELSDLLSGTPAVTADEIDSMQELEALLHMIAEAQRKKVQAEKSRLRATALLDRILSLTHCDQPDFPPLAECQAKARALREAIRLSTGSEPHTDAVALAQGRHPLAELLTLVEGAHDLEDDLWLLLKQAASEHFGKSLAVSAARGKLTVSSGQPAVGLKEEEHGDEPAVSAAGAGGATG